MAWGAWEAAIICPLVFIGGFIDAVAGGGGLVTLPAFMLASLPVHVAIGTNKLSAGMGLMISASRYASRGWVPWRLAIACAACALVGAQCGVRLALMLDERTFKLIMLFILPPTALWVMRGRALSEDLPPLGPVRTHASAMAIALVIGAYDGAYGPGAGTFMMLALRSVAHLELGEANGVTKVMNTTSCFSSLAVYLINGKVIVPLGLLAGAFSIAGNWLGARCFDRGGAKIVRPIMLIVLGAFFVRLIAELIMS